MEKFKLFLVAGIILAVVAGAVYVYASTAYNVQSDNTIKIKVLPTPTPSAADPSSSVVQTQDLTAHLTISADTINAGQDVKVTATLNKPVKGITLTLRWMEAGQPTFNSADEVLLQQCLSYLSSPQCHTTAVTDENGVAVFDLGTGLPPNSGAFSDGWRFTIMLQTATVG